MSSISREALKASASKPGEIGVASSTLSDARALHHLLRIVDVARAQAVDDVGRPVAQHALGADVEELDDAFLVGGDDREVGAGEDRVLQRARLEERGRAPQVGRAARLPGIVGEVVVACGLRHACFRGSGSGCFSSCIPARDGSDVSEGAAKKGKHRRIMWGIPDVYSFEIASVGRCARSVRALPYRHGGRAGLRAAADLSVGAQTRPAARRSIALRPQPGKRFPGGGRGAHVGTPVMSCRRQR